MNGTEQTVEWTEREVEQWKAIQKKQTFTLAFSGHFSSGKSTLLNELIGAELLPTSPIPTSANQVFISNGDLGVEVEEKGGNVSRQTGNINWEEIRKYGMDGVRIKRLNIFAPIPFLKQASELVDTPGVDSTDPTHQAMTMDALFTTDAVLYVMDYNHVKAETNLHFLKQLSDEGKPLFIVINQIDKHVEAELAFTDYKESIFQTFESWKINYLTIYFTSMRTAKNNERNRLKSEIKAVLANGVTLAAASKQRLERSFYLALKRRLHDEEQEALEELAEQVKAKGYSIEDIHAYEQEQNRLTELENASQNRQAFFMKEWDSLFRQATLFNATLTERAQQWLEAMKPNFRVGMLFSKRKTEEERRLRTELFVNDLQDQIQSQLVFHLQRSLQTIPVEHMKNKETFLEALHQVAFQVSDAFLKEALPTETVGPEYVYQYSKARTEEIILALKKRALTALEFAQKGLAHSDNEVWERGKKELERRQELIPFVNRYLHFSENYAKQIHLLERSAKSVDDSGKLEIKLKAVLQKPLKEAEDLDWTNDLLIDHPETLLKAEKVEVVEDVAVFQELDQKELSAVLGAYKGKKWGTEWRQRLYSRLNLMENEQFTISLFGAFSAGKSSFANALFGEDVLPTSPHPTTAAVTTVTYPTAEATHGTVTIRYKTYDQLEEELSSIARLIGRQLTPQTLQSVRLTEVRADTAGKKQAVAYLKTLQQSLKQRETLLSTNETVTVEQLADLVANEEAACLIADAIIYYKCGLTEAGLTLVDTPGVNSVHGRHTNVAYNQVKNSDAIFYVTYYNHSFSKADAQFIEQLGKINQQFTSKKLYFILNAVDLAANEAEQKGVESYVYKSLQSAGANEVKLFAVSSKEALNQKKEDGEAGGAFALFERELYGPMLHSLKQLSEQLLLNEVASYRSYLQEMKKYAGTDKASQQQLLDETKGRFKDLIKQFQEEEGAPLRLRLEQETSELFTYLRERIHYVIRDAYMEYVNVAVVTGVGKKQQREALLNGLVQWKEEALFYLEQELKATSIRLTLSFQRQYERWAREWQETIQQAYPGFYLGRSTKMSKFELKQNQMETSFNPESYSQRFTSLKSFFEQGESAKLKEEASIDLSEEMSLYLRGQEERALSAVSKVVNEIVDNEQQRMKTQMDAEVGRLHLFTEPDLVCEMENEQAALERWVEKQT